MKNVLILGAGMVARPMVKYLLEKQFNVTIASRTLSKAEALIGGHTNGKAIAWTVDQEDDLFQLVKESNLVVSLLPYAYHVLVAKMCIELGIDMVTTSYVKPEMQALDEAAKKANIIILNEIGLDPGIDHMSAMRIIDHVHNKGGKIEEFYSITGALPAPEAADNPFKYKFSWSPKGVVMAGNNDGKYLRHGKIHDIPTENLFKDTFKVTFPKVGELESYPNRDSISYIDIYDIEETQTMYRGTFRYKGWCESIDAMKELKLITNEKLDLSGKSFADMVAILNGFEDSSEIRKKAADKLGLDVDAYALDTLEWLGLFSEESIGRDEDTPFEVTSDLMIEKMELGNKERDMVVMQHTFLASYPDGKTEVIKSSMLDFGTPETDTSVARTVSLPAAIAVQMILEGKISLKGVYRPTLPDIYNPVLDTLEKIDIRMEEEFGLPESANIK